MFKRVVGIKFRNKEQGLGKGQSRQPGGQRHWHKHEWAVPRPAAIH